MLFDKLQDFRLDPTNEDNMKNWLFLRIKLLEDDDIERHIKESIGLMNISFTITIMFMTWVVKNFFFDNRQKAHEVEPTIMVFLTLSILLMIIGPVFGILNDTVAAHNLVDTGCF